MLRINTLRNFCAVLRISAIAFCIGSMAIATTASASTDSIYSYWIKNLSQDADPDHLYDHSQVKVATSGNYVHVAWIAAKSDLSDEEVLFYRRSSDGGKTFSAPIELAHIPPRQGSIQVPSEWNNLVASGAYVQLYYVETYYSGPPRLFYLSSSDYGETFEQAKILGEGYVDFQGVYASAQKANAVVAWATSGDHSVALYCSYSSDGGKSYGTTVIASDDDSDGSMAYQFHAEDLASSGSNVYILNTVELENWSSSQSYLYLWSSTDGCKSFKPGIKVNAKAADKGYYAPRIQDANYSPNLAADGNNVSIVWVNVDNPGSFDGWNALTLRTRASADAGTTLTTSKILYSYPAGYSSTNGAQPGLETIVRNKANLYITTTMTTPDHSGTYRWRSTDGGSSWSKEKLIANDGWWPMLGIDPVLSSNVYVANGWFFKSKDSGNIFDGGFAPHFDFCDYDAPRFVVDAKGTPHFAGSSNARNQYMGHEIFYRRLAPASTPDANSYVLKLAKTAGDPSTPSHLQIPSTKSIQMSKAMTVEFWVKRQSGDWTYYENLLSKSRLYGEGSYELGTWKDFQIYSRLVTSQSADSINGDWLGSDVNLKKNVWTHIAMTYDDAVADNNWRIYVNGELHGQTTLHGTIVTDAGRLLIGDPLLGSDVAGTVFMDELRLWPVARSQQQIKDAMSRPLAGQDTGVAVYLNFDKTFKDITGQGNDAFPKYKEGFIAGVPF